MSPRQKRYKLLLDEMLPRRENFPILNRTHDVKHIVHDLGSPGLKDEEVLKIARKQGRILITKNIKNFFKKCRKHQVDMIGVTETIFYEELDRSIMAKLRRQRGKRMKGRITKIVSVPRKR